MDSKNFTNQQLPNYLLISQAKKEFEQLVQQQLAETLEKHFGKYIKKIVPNTWSTKDMSEVEISAWSDFNENKYSDEIEWISVRVCWDTRHLNGMPFAKLAMQFKNKNNFKAYGEDYKYRNEDDESYEYEDLGSSIVGVYICESQLLQFFHESLIESLKKQLDHLIEKTKEDLDDFIKFLNKA